MAAVLVLLECITNMHVGNGDVNYNIIDNEVERDPVTAYPTINSSGVKGALREYFKAEEPAKITDVFGADKADKAQGGKLKFLTADMIAIPVRASAGKAAYYLVTTEEALNRYREVNDIFLNRNIELKRENVSGCEAEGITLTEKIILENKDLYIVSKEKFNKISLPVLARNCLENGISKNLWYEEVVPHKSLFAFAVVADDSDKELLEYFKNKINGQVVQFGGNASIGYGLCKVTVMEG